MELLAPLELRVLSDQRVTKARQEGWGLQAYPEYQAKQDYLVALGHLV